MIKRFEFKIHFKILVDKNWNCQDILKPGFFQPSRKKWNKKFSLMTKFCMVWIKHYTFWNSFLNCFLVKKGEIFRYPVFTSRTWEKRNLGRTASNIKSGLPLSSNEYVVGVVVCLCMDVPEVYGVQIPARVLFIFIFHTTSCWQVGHTEGIMLN